MNVNYIKLHMVPYIGLTLESLAISGLRRRSAFSINHFVGSCQAERLILNKIINIVKSMSRCMLA